MTANTYDVSGSDLPAGPSKGTVAFFAFALLCLLPLSSDTFVSMVAQASGVTGILAYAFAWSVAYAVGLILAAGIGIPAVVLWHLLSRPRD